MCVVCGKGDVACAVRDTRELVEEVEEVLGRLEWFDRGDAGGGWVDWWEIGRSGKEPESTRMCVMNVLGFGIGLVLRGGSDGGVSGMRSSCRSVDRRTSLRGYRGDCGDCGVSGDCCSLASLMMGLDISRGCSRFVKRRKIDFFLNSCGGSVELIANMTSMRTGPTLLLGCGVWLKSSETR